MDYQVFHRIFSEISYSTAFLTDAHSAPSEIDRVIRDAYIYQRPTYLGFPSNFFDIKVPASLLDIPLQTELKSNDLESEKEVVETILELVKDAKNPIILVDSCASRHKVIDEVEKLIDITQFPVYVTPLGKGSINEHHPRFGGVYVGQLSTSDVKEAVESADLVISVGSILSDYNTGAWSYGITKNVVELHSDYTKIKTASFPGVQMKYVLQKLLTSIDSAISNYSPVAVPEKKIFNTQVADDSVISQTWFWNRFSKWLRPGDIVISETGTSSFGVIQTKFAPNTTGISQVLWGSIGYSVGSCLGAVMAAEELDKSKRVILFVGDGSLQLSVQEISTMIKWNLKPYLFVLNNDGYTIERLIHGLTASYNDVQGWDHKALLPAFGAKDYLTATVSTTGEFNKYLEDATFQEPNQIKLIEVMIPKLDAPDNLKKQAEISEKTNAE